MPLHRNRSREAWATLYDATGTAVYSFRTRGHGHRESEWDGPSQDWPDFGDGDAGLTQFAPSGDTPTGIAEVDLNTPEGNATLYGPYPVNRVVRGLKGNAAFLLPSIRDGILLHTGAWGSSNLSAMPNSAGCVRRPSVLVDVATAFKKTPATRWAAPPRPPAG